MMKSVLRAVYTNRYTNTIIAARIHQLPEVKYVKNTYC